MGNISAQYSLSILLNKKEGCKLKSMSEINTCSKYCLDYIDIIEELLFHLLFIMHGTANLFLDKKVFKPQYKQSS